MKAYVLVNSPTMETAEIVDMIRKVKDVVAGIDPRRLEFRITDVGGMRKII